MRNSNSNNTGRRQSFLTAYRIGTIVLLLTLVAICGVLLSRPVNQPAPITVAQTDRVAAAASYLQDVGFNNPVYLGITPGSESEYPTFRATAIGGKPVNLWIRTTSNGGWEIQPSMMFETVASADDFARKATDAVSSWEHIPSSIKPRTDGAYGEYESRKYEYGQLKDYAPGSDYWRTTVPSDTAGWPSK